MKNIFILFLIVSLISCEDNSTLKSILESNDVEQIKLKRKQIAAAQQDFSSKLQIIDNKLEELNTNCLLYTSPSPRDVEESRMPSSA